MKISIAMATYNGQKHLVAQLSSFLTQSRQPDELIVSDDGSTDGTLDILEDFSRSSPFPVVIIPNMETLGYAGNFNRALSATTGDLVFLSDQDDVWYNNKLKTVEAVATSHPESMVIMNDALITDENLHQSSLTKLGQIRSCGLPIGSFVMGCCIAIRKEFLKVILPIPEGYHSHDGWIVSIADGIGRRYVIDHSLQFYRRHNRNTSKILVNSSRRVTRIDHILSLTRHLVQSTRQRTHALAIEDAIRWNNMLREGIQRALTQCDDELRVAFNLHAEHLTNRAEAMHSRLRATKMNFSKRLYQTTRLWMAGGYRHFNGAKTALHDIVSR